VRMRGTATVTAAALKRSLGNVKFEPAERLAAVVERWRRGGARIGFTNGVFDLLHPGHLHLLRYAKSACDRLIVALNDDESASRLKPGRPIQDLAARIEVVSGLDCVDIVTSVHAPTPLSLIEVCRPDVLVKGGDYGEEDVVGREFAGRVLIVPLLAGHSTTATVSKTQRVAA
jgi:D-beta-D-heptose 7-phosphate kinase / D-beta-D-heptose 1-phosphate adenosyltransferase